MKPLTESHCHTGGRRVRKRERTSQASGAMQVPREADIGLGSKATAPERASSSGDDSSGLTETRPSAKSGSQHQGRRKKRRVQNEGGFPTGGAGAELAEEGDGTGDLRAHVAAIMRDADLEKLTLRQVSVTSLHSCHIHVLMHVLQQHATMQCSLLSSLAAQLEKTACCMRYVAGNAHEGTLLLTSVLCSVDKLSTGDLAGDKSAARGVRMHSNSKSHTQGGGLLSPGVPRYLLSRFLLMFPFSFGHCCQCINPLHFSDSMWFIFTHSAEDVLYSLIIHLDGLCRC